MDRQPAANLGGSCDRGIGDIIASLGEVRGEQVEPLAGTFRPCERTKGAIEERQKFPPFAENGSHCLMLIRPRPAPQTANENWKPQAD